MKCWAEQGAGAGASSVLGSRDKSRRVESPQCMGSWPNSLQGRKAFTVMSILFGEKKTQPNQKRVLRYSHGKVICAIFSVNIKKWTTLGCKWTSDFNYFALEKRRDREGFQVRENCIKRGNMCFMIIFHKGWELLINVKIWKERFTLDQKGFSLKTSLKRKFMINSQFRFCNELNWIWMVDGYTSYSSVRWMKQHPP